jgi:hypothetical protein
LWPEKFDETALARIKANITAQDWAALYQQEPTENRKRCRNTHKIGVILRALLPQAGNGVAIG